MTQTRPTAPPMATGHCRFYSYQIGADQGPRCARGIDLSAPGSARMCMPDGGRPRGLCSQREEWTEAERAAWGRWVADNAPRWLLDRMAEDEA